MAGFSGYYINHSLCTTAMTRLFEENVDQQLTMAKTGHASTAVRSYKCINEQQLPYLSNVVACKKLALSINERASVQPALPLPATHLSSSSTLSSASACSENSLTTSDKSGSDNYCGGGGIKPVL